MRGPQYESITYYALGVGWYVTFVNPDLDAEYGWIAFAALVMFCIAIGYTLLLIVRGVHSSPSSPQA